MDEFSVNKFNAFNVNYMKFVEDFNWYSSRNIKIDRFF